MDDIEGSEKRTAGGRCAVAIKKWNRGRVSECDAPHSPGVDTPVAASGPAIGGRAG